MKLNLGKTLFKALEAGGAAALGTVSVQAGNGIPVDVQTAGIVGAVCALARAIINIFKVLRKKKSEDT